MESSGLRYGEDSESTAADESQGVNMQHFLDEHIIEPETQPLKRAAPFRRQGANLWEDDTLKDQYSPDDLQDLKRKKPQQLVEISDDDLKKLVQANLQRHQQAVALLQDPFIEFARMVAGSLNLRLEVLVQSPVRQFFGSDDHPRHSGVDTLLHSPFVDLTKLKPDPEDDESAAFWKRMTSVLKTEESDPEQRATAHRQLGLGAIVDAMRDEQGRLAPGAHEYLENFQTTSRLRQHQDWLTRFGTMGSAAPTPLLQAAMQDAHLRIVTDCSGLRSASIEQLITQNVHVRRLYASLVTQFIRDAHFFQGSHRAFDRNHGRVVRELNATVQQLQRWELTSAGEFRQRVHGSLVMPLRPPRLASNRRRLLV